MPGEQAGLYVCVITRITSVLMMGNTVWPGCFQELPLPCNKQSSQEVVRQHAVLYCDLHTVVTHCLLETVVTMCAVLHSKYKYVDFCTGCTRLGAGGARSEDDKIKCYRCKKVVSCLVCGVLGTIPTCTTHPSLPTWLSCMLTGAVQFSAPFLLCTPFYRTVL